MKWGSVAGGAREGEERRDEGARYNSGNRDD